MTSRGMMIAIPQDEWVVFHDLTPVEMGAVLVELAGKASSDHSGLGTFKKITASGGTFSAM